MITAAAIFACMILLCLAIFQLALILGAPLGHYAWGGAHKILPTKVLTIEFKLRGLNFIAINAGPDFHFTEAVSFMIACEDQAEIDFYWEKLSKVPESAQCGWCKDQFGLSWQVTPKNMEELMQRPDAFAKLMQMKKLVISEF